MNDEVEYDPQELERLVTEALGEINTSGSRDMFSFGDTQMLQHLQEILPNFVQHHGDTQVILGELRDALYDGMSGHLDKGTALRQLHTAVTNCRKCPLMKPDPQLPKWNLLDPDVVFVTDLPSAGVTKEFVGMLKDAGFTSSRIALTSVARCYPDEYRPPNAEEVVNCTTRFLFTELQLWKPQLIVPMGGLASSVLLGGEVKITSQRGKLFWTGPWAIMPIYSPNYAVRNASTQNELTADLQQAHNLVYGKTA